MTNKTQTGHSDKSKFPDPAYKKTVLGPLFESAKAHEVEPLRAIDQAHLVMLSETGILERGDASAIAKALDEVARELDVAALEYTGEVEDFFFLLERELKTRVGPDIAGRLHTGRSRNDIGVTYFKMRLRDAIDEMFTKLHKLIAAMIDTAEREKNTIIVAYTHGQPAQPATYGHYLAAEIEVLLRDTERLATARKIVDLCPMGAAAITTSGFPLDRELVAELLGFAASVENSYGAIASVDYITATYSALELIFLHMGRPFQNLQFWTSFEVGQLYVPNAFVQISSIMPQKRNPVPVEHMRLLASHTMSRSRAMLDVMHNTPFTDMNDAEHDTHDMGHQAFATANRVLDLYTAMLPALSINADRVAENIRRSCATITELADSVVRIENLSFRQAHEISSSVARAVIAKDGDLARDGYEPFAEAFNKTADRTSTIDAKQFAKIVSAEHFVAVRERFGGPGNNTLGNSLNNYRKMLKTLTNQLLDDKQHQAKSKALLQDKFQELL